MRNPYSGWVKVWRQLLEHPVLAKDNDALRIWLQLLLTAEHREHGEVLKWGPAYHAGTQLGAGHVIVNERDLAVACNVNHLKVHRVLHDMQKRNEIELMPSKSGTYVRILKWNQYQSKPPKKAL